MFWRGYSFDGRLQKSQCQFYYFLIHSVIIQFMLLPYLPILNQKKIILGSKSKGRNYLMTTQKINYEKVPSSFVENLDKQSFPTPSDYNMATCKGKANDLASTFQKQQKQWDILICGDTIICDQNKIIEKPIDAQDCIKMMSSLANKTHQACTAHVVIFNTEPQIRFQWVTKTDVTFGDVSLDSLKQYAKTQDPYYNSGGYQLEGVSGSFIKEIKGSLTSVLGLDTYELCMKIIEGSRKVKWIQ